MAPQHIAYQPETSLGLLRLRLYLKHAQTQDSSDREAAARLEELMLNQDGAPFRLGTVLKMSVCNDLSTAAGGSREVVD